MNISVIIPVGPGREKLLQYTLQGLSEQTRLPDEVILTSNQPLVPMVFPSNLKIVQLVNEGQAPNTGAVNRNRGVAAAMGEFYFFVDSEVVLVPTAIQVYEEDLSQFPMRVIVGPYHRLGPMTPDEDWHIFHGPKIRTEALHHLAHQHALGHVPESGLDNRGVPWEIVSPKNLYCDYRKCLMLLGGNMIMHREVFERAGGFWEELNMGEDGAFGLALCQQGCVWSFDSRALGYHLYHPKESWVNWEPVRVKLMERFHSDKTWLGQMKKDWGWPWEEVSCSLLASV